MFAESVGGVSEIYICFCTLYYRIDRRKKIIMPNFFRLLYCCGLRLTEARLLKVKDVDLQEGVITVTNGELGFAGGSGFFNSQRTQRYDAAQRSL